jgi:muramoyltetrapeptide carboxypeptidase
MNVIPFLKPGDRIALAAPARYVTRDEMAPAIGMLRSWGLEVVTPLGLYDTFGQLAGTDGHRAALLQRLLDDDGISAILCCRGGYGTVRIIDRLDFSSFSQHPKWIIGYSDVTVLHSHIHATLGFPTLHATMPINMGDEPSPATQSLQEVLFGTPVSYQWQPHHTGRVGKAEGMVVGGNLSILYSLLGSASQVDTKGKILLIEDLDEYLYHIDRMMQALRRAGMLEGLAGLVVGGLTQMHDNQVSYGRTAQQIVLDAVSAYGYPVVFDAPFGHLGADNLALPLGVPMRLTVSPGACASLCQI